MFIFMYIFFFVLWPLVARKARSLHNMFQRSFMNLRHYFCCHWLVFALASNTRDFSVTRYNCEYAKEATNDKIIKEERLNHLPSGAKSLTQILVNHRGSETGSTTQRVTEARWSWIMHEVEENKQYLHIHIYSM